MPPGFLRRSLSLSLPAGLLVAPPVLAVNAFAAIVGGHAAEAVRTGSVMTLSLVALGILVAIARPLSRQRLGVIATMCAGLILVLALPASQEFLTLEWPPLPLLAVSLGAALGGTIGVAVLARVHTRRYPDGDPLDGANGTT
jgi:cation-transporting ATPase E